MIGISLMRVGVGWAAGAPAPNLPGYGDPFNLGVAGLVMLIILGLTRFVKGFFGNIAVLMGIVLGCLLCYFVWGTMSMKKVVDAPVFALIYPFQFGMPRFNIAHIITMCIVMVVVLIESAGMFLALSDMTGKKVSQSDMTRGLAADGVGTMIGGIMNTFPYNLILSERRPRWCHWSAFRWVTVAGGLIMVVMRLIPKLGALAESIPLYVLGGAGIVMFGMVAATGIRILSDVDFKTNRFNLFIVALSVGFGLIPLVHPQFFNKVSALMPSLGPILHSGIILTAIVSVVLNVFFNGVQSREEAEAAAARTTHGNE